MDQSESMAGQCKVLCRTAVSVLVSAVMMCNGDPDIIRLDWKWQILAAVAIGPLVAGG